MAERIFINYRRDDAKADARSIHQSLERTFGKVQVFIDVSSLAKGADFVDQLKAELARTTVLVVVIGPRWLAASDDNGIRRIDQEEDFVRLEIRTALERGIKIIPVLVDGANMPGASELPEDIRPFVRRNAVRVMHESFDSDIDVILNAIRRRPSGRSFLPRLGVVVGLLVFLTAGVLVSLFMMQLPRRIPAQSRSPQPALDVDRPLAIEEEGRLTPGTQFRECPGCPEMIVIPTGSFKMGATPEEVGSAKSEYPRHDVQIGYAFALATTEVTLDQFAEFANATGYYMGETCREQLGSGMLETPGSFRAPGYPISGRHPATCVSWNDASAYVAWLAKRTRKPYRLPTEAEWEYAARAGTTTPYWFGTNAEAACQNANIADHSFENFIINWSSVSCDDGHKFTAPVASFKPNAFGLYDMIGNVWEWTADCWVSGFASAPADGTAVGQGDCGRRALKGGGWESRAQDARASSRFGIDAQRRSNLNGFRVARQVVE